MSISTDNLRVLVIEDNLGDYILIEEYLKEEIHNLTIVHAKTFTLAKSTIASGEKFDILLLDLTLPDASGEELVNEALKLSGNIPLIVLTGYGNKNFSIKTLGLGVSDYLLKDDLNATQLYKSIVYSIERKRNITELKISEEKYRNLFHSSPLPMWVYSPETFMFLDVNAAAVRHYGYSKEEFLNMTIKAIRPEKEIAQLEKIVRTKKENDNYYTGIFNHFKKNGELIQVNIQSNSIDFAGKKARLVVANDVTETVKIQSEIKRSEQRFRALVQEGSDLICILDLRGDYKYVSPTSQSILGMAPEQFIGKNAFDFIHSEDKESVIHQFKLLATEKRIHISPFRFKSHDNSYRWIETIITNMMEDSSINGMVANSRDVSDRYTYEEKLRKQDSLFKAINEKGSDMKTLITPEGKIIFGTPSISRILGFTREEYLNLNERDLVHPDDVEELFHRIRLTISNEGAFGHMQLRIKNKQGAYRWCEKTITNLLQDPDVNAIVCHFWDITDKRKAELKIKESNDRYDLVSKATSDAIWDYKFTTNKTYIAGTGYKNLFGYAIVNDYTSDQFWENRLHPEDKEYIIKKLKGFIEDVDQTQCQYEYRFLRADGTYAYVNDRLFIIRENKIPSRIIGAINDISKRKEEEQHLKLLESIITNANDAVMITEASPVDEPGPKIIYVNESLLKMSGYSKEEIIGKTPRIFQGPKSDRHELDKLRTKIENKEACGTEIINYTKSGKPYWVGIEIAPVTDTSGNVSHMIAIEKDITSRKLQEQEREKLIFELLQNNKDLRQFSYITSHNLRGPIAQLMGLTNLLDNYKLEDTTLAKILLGIKKAAGDFDETVKDLSTVLDIKDRSSIACEEISLELVYTKVMGSFKSLIEESNAQVRYDFSNAPFIHFNKAYMESIFMNLLTNAIKYCSRSIPLNVFITTEDHDDEIVLKFKDNGRGMDVELHKEKLFGLYQRFHQNTDGKGLGLFLIKSQLEALQGTIHVESKINEGTLFVLRFKKQHSNT